jgi:hypothetical protein
MLSNFWTGATCILSQDCDAWTLINTPADEMSDEQISAVAAAVTVGGTVADGQKQRGRELLANAANAGDAAFGWLPSKKEWALYGLAALAVVVFVAKKS